MTVAELILRLQAVDPTLEVRITDGWAGAIYEGAFQITVAELGHDKQILDIGIGGYLVEEKR